MRELLSWGWWLDWFSFLKYKPSRSFFLVFTVLFESSWSFFLCLQYLWHHFILMFISISFMVLSLNFMFMLFLIMRFNDILWIALLVPIFHQFFLCQFFKIFSLHSFKLNLLTCHNLHFIFANHFGSDLNPFVFFAWLSCIPSIWAVWVQCIIRLLAIMAFLILSQIILVIFVIVITYETFLAVLWDVVRPWIGTVYHLLFNRLEHVDITWTISLGDLFHHV